jgi:hypothetical protein
MAPACYRPARTGIQFRILRKDRGPSRVPLSHPFPMPSLPRLNLNLCFLWDCGIRMPFSRGKTEDDGDQIELQPVPGVPSRSQSNAPVEVGGIGEFRTNVATSVIRSNIGVSRWYASRIRQGYRPHPRHWQALADLTGVMPDV